MNLANKIKSRKYGVTAVVVASIFLATALLSLNSFYFSNYSWKSSNDGYVFMTIAKQMHDGAMPYRDLFDHKGPLVYLIYYVGTCVKGMKGLWAMQVLANAVTFVFIYKTARLFTTRLKSAFAVMLTLGAFFTFGTINNTVKPECWAFPFIAISTYYFYDYFKNDKWSYVRVFLVGVCLGSCLMMKANLTAPWIVFGIYLIVHSVQNKRLPQFFKMLSVLIAGIIAVIAPFIVWLKANGTLGSFVECYLVFNLFEYSHYEETHVFEYFFNLLCNQFVFVMLVLQVFVLIKNKSNLDLLSFLCFVITMLFATAGSNYGSTEFAMPACFCLIPTCAHVLNLLVLKKLQTATVVFDCIAVFVLVPGSLNEVGYDLCQIQSYGPIAEQPSYKYTETAAIAQYIKDNSASKDKIAVQTSFYNIFYNTRKMLISSFFFNHTR